MSNNSLEYEILINSGDAKKALSDLFAAFQKLSNVRPVGNVGGIDESAIRRGTRALNDQADAVSGLRQGLVRFAQFAAGYVGFKALADQLKQVGDAIKEQEAAFSRLSFANDGDTAKAADDLKFLREQADRLGQPLREVAGSYGQLAAATKGTVLQGEATRQIFLGVAEAATVLKLSSADVEGSMLALTQSVGKGKLSAEEFRQQLGERMPIALEAGARALGVTREEFNKLLESGSIDAQSFLPKFAEELRKLAQEQLPRSTDSFVASQNRFSNAILNLRQSLGKGELGGALKDSIDKATDSLNSPALQTAINAIALAFAKAVEWGLKLIQLVSDGTKIVGAFGAIFVDTVKTGSELVGGMGAVAASRFVAGFQKIVPKITEIFNNVVARIRVAIASMFESAAGWAMTAGDSGTAGKLYDAASSIRKAAIANKEAAEDARGEMARIEAEAAAREQAITRRMDETHEQFQARRKAILDNLAKDVFGSGQSAKKDNTPAITNLATLNIGSGSKGDKAGSTEAQARRDAKALADYQKAVYEYAEKAAAAERTKALAALEKDFAARLLTQTEYLRRKADLERQEIDLQVEAANRRIAELQAVVSNEKAAKDERLKAAADIVKVRGELEELDGRRAVIGIKFDADTAETQRYLADLKADIEANLLDLSGSTGAAARSRLAAETRKLLEDPRVMESPELQGLIRQQETAKQRIIEIEDVSRRAQLSMSELSLTESAITRQVEAGMLSELDAQKQIREARLATAEAMREQVEAAERLAELTGDPQQILAAKQLRDEYETLAGTANAAAKDLNDTFFGSLKQGLNDLVTGVKSVSDVIKTIISDLLSKLAEMFLNRALTNMMAGMGGASGGIGGFLSGLFGFATGGYVMGPGTETSDSILAKLSRGEFVIKAASVRALGLDTLNYINRYGSLPRFATGGFVDGGLGGGSTTVQNSVNTTAVLATERVINELMQSPDFERGITDIVVSRWRRIQGAAG